MRRVQHRNQSLSQRPRRRQVKLKYLKVLNRGESRRVDARDELRGTLAP